MVLASTPIRLSSLEILRELQPILPGAHIEVGRTNLPLMVVPLEDASRGPLKVFYNLAPKQFRVVNDRNPKYEFRCGTPDELLAELENQLDCSLPETPESIAHLK